MKDFGCEFLCILRRTFMNKQIRPILRQRYTYRRERCSRQRNRKNGVRQDAFKERTMLMSRASKGAVAHLNVLRQRVIKRWQQILFILTGCGFQLQPLLRVAVDYRRNARR